MKNSRLYKILTNRYAMVGLAAFLWMMFADDYNFISQWKLRREISRLEEDMAYYQTELEKVNEERLIFKENREEIERFAREQYLMKKENEDLFLVVE
jgi:cell division protein DivIC